ncbi:CBS domain-containing protein [Neobacillus cucumis]|uniref:CBS domain-containing protein n=1 Tax=Neobacillus cucumis TaxID=1740721 RepID=A0A2N5H9Z4_9BACI|nr:CBS domain-containing protein [Neobacillus cucumis]PLS02338.1 hypothetical protein CVD27_20370 [Neobacillus cucumis]
MLLERNQTPLLSERFEVAFNQIHESLRKIVQIKDDRFVVLVKAGARNFQIVDTYKEELEQYAKLRNAIVHEKTEIGYYIAEPNRSVVERIEKIASIMGRPNYALTIATKQVVYFNMDDKILDVIHAIKEYGYSQYPIYQNKECVGLLSTGAIVKWMAANVQSSAIYLTNILVSDILQAEKALPVKFAPKSINIFEVESIFEKEHLENKDLEAVIITENGKCNETPIGLITAWDLIEIDYTAD